MPTAATTHMAMRATMVRARLSGGLVSFSSTVSFVRCPDVVLTAFVATVAAVCSVV